MILIHHINQPSRLLLVWQPPEGKSRTRFVVGELCVDGEDYVFRYLDNTEDFANAIKEGFVCYPAFRKLNHEYNEGVLETFLRRIPPRKRGDFNKYLEQWRLAPGIDISDFALLGHTGAKLPNDGFSLINPFDGIDAPFEFYIEVAGFRYQDNICLDDISVGMEVNFVSEPENSFDQQAVRIETMGRKIGYVNKAQCPAFTRWLERYSITACIERINGTEARPLIYIYGRVHFANIQQIAA
jgi:hypothetical protein